MSTESSLFQRFGKTFDKNSVIFHEGEKGEHLYIIQEGEVELTKDETKESLDHIRKLAPEVFT